MPSRVLAPLRARSRTRTQTVRGAHTSERSARHPGGPGPWTGVARLLSGRPLQPTIELGEAHDRHEREAERIAKQISTRPQAPLGAVTPPNTRPVLETLSSHGLHQAGGQGGRPLPQAVRSYFEPRFGHDLSPVRVHEGAGAIRSASALGAKAFTVGAGIWLGQGQSVGDKRLMAHELSHVVQQHAPSTGARLPSGERLSAVARPRVQRVVAEGNVSCRAGGLHGGVPGGRLTGDQVLTILRNADTEAIRLGRRAENLLTLQRLTHGSALYTADPVFDASLLNRFGLSLANPGDHRSIAILEREFKAVTDYLVSGRVRYTCRGADCETEYAYTFGTGPRMYLCNPFWNLGSSAIQGATLLHEAMHLWWSQVNDAGNPMHNAHCFEQFALDLAGIAIPADVVGQC